MTQFYQDAGAKSGMEINFDGLVGPTHNFGGLALGNLASTKHANLGSNPKQAALEGLAKMEQLMKLGLKQAVLPPQQRPSLGMLRKFGYCGTNAQVINKVAKDNPKLLHQSSSAAAMWTANAATVTPSADTADNRVHLTPANLATNLHRTIEAPQTFKVLRTIFADPNYFMVHQPLPYPYFLSDEGAANHNRLITGGHKASHLFVYGKNCTSHDLKPQRYPARQTLEACQTIARNHLIAPEQALFAQQNPDAIDAGVFHNDVISVAHEEVFLCHEQAFVDTFAVIEQLRAQQPDLHIVLVTSEQLELKDAVTSYLFNSQIVTLPDSSMALICPNSCQLCPKTQTVITNILAGDNPIKQVHYQNLSQSLDNGGGPACLRLRVQLTTQEQHAMHQGVLLNQTKIDSLKTIVQQYYPLQLSFADLASYELYQHNQQALERISQVLGLEGIYLT